MTLQIIFKNEFFVAIDKPSAMLSVPSRLGRADPRPVAGIMLQEQLKTQVYPLHRLDEDTSGLLIFALTSEASKVGNQWFERHEIQKTYAAISIPAKPDQLGRWGKEQLWQCLLVRGKKRAFEATHGKPSITKARLVGHTSEGRSIWQLQPITGRAHQLRYEMARHGFPIDGDVLYGSSSKPRSDSGIDLRAYCLDFRLCRDRSRFRLPDDIIVGAFD